MSTALRPTPRLSAPSSPSSPSRPSRLPRPYRVLRLIGVGVRTHVGYMSRSPLEITFAVLVPLVYATLAVYLFRAGGDQGRMLQASVGAGLMGMWASVLFGSGGAVQNQRWLGTLETLTAAPTPLALTLLPVTLATAVVGTYAMGATLLWGAVLFGTPLHFAHLLLFLVAVPVCVLALGMMGLLLASTFVLMRNANALANALDHPIWLLSGMLVPITVLPSWTHPISWVLPTTWGARAVQAAALPGHPTAEVLRCLALTVGSGLGYLLLAVVALTHVERRARRAATLALA
ncbi:ABC transporter permease [Streptacidiphilus pinicola]|uniref:ABC transporter permease n=1 Tax=Streptacidiphilus pinicola TaxID=2219663 RepID=A0A2X0K475_9ACTN|nr:ABC transporter permease [Streptacidiphilus pinicola]RAG84055.1 ABC transporter permease [Streptacidiphilus pinicola]